MSASIEICLLVFESRSYGSNKLASIWRILSGLLVLHGEPVQSFERRIPALFRPMFLRNLYGWLVIKRLARSYDIVLLRHMPFDPFVFFLRSDF